MARTVQYQKGAVIFFEGESPKFIYILKNGNIEISRLDHETKSTTHSSIKEGHFFGVKNKLVNTPYMSTATAVEDSTVILLSTDEFENSISMDKKISAEIIKNFCNQLKQVHAKLYHKHNGAQKEWNKESGMFNTARGFFDMKEYSPCKDVCDKFMEQFPESNYKQKINEMEAASREKMYWNNKKEPCAIFHIADDSELLLPSSFSHYEKTIAARKVIFSEFEKGDSVFMVTSGIVRSTKYIGGANVSISLATPGEFFGLNAFIGKDTRDVSCVSITDAKVLEFQHSEFENIISENPKIAFMFIKLLAKRIYLDRKILRNNYINDLQIRLKDMFTVLDDNGLCEKIDSKSRRIYLSAKNISIWTNIPEEEIEQELQLLENNGVIRNKDGCIIVSNIEDSRNVSQAYFSHL